MLLIGDGEKVMNILNQVFGHATNEQPGAATRAGRRKGFPEKGKDGQDRAINCGRKSLG
jgi:hypothetical protein